MAFFLAMVVTIIFAAIFYWGYRTDNAVVAWLCASYGSRGCLFVAIPIGFWKIALDPYIDNAINAFDNLCGGKGNSALVIFGIIGFVGAIFVCRDLILGLRDGSISKRYKVVKFLWLPFVLILNFAGIFIYICWRKALLPEMARQKALEQNNYPLQRQEE